MKKPWNHLSVLLLLLLVVFAAYRHVMALPLWNPIDFELLYDAHVMSANLGEFYRHIGNLFSQPLLRLGLLLEYRAFGLDPTGYLAVNLAVHALNAFVFYLLVYMLFPQERLAMLAALLFALSVGSYGKLLMSLAGVESLAAAFFYLVVLYALIRNDFHHGGRIRSRWYLLGMAVFVLAGLTRPVSFSILGSLVAYRFFYYKERGGRGVFPPSLLLVMGVGILLFVAQHIWGWRAEGPDAGPGMSPWLTVWYTLKNIFRYLNLMVFPLQVSSWVESSSPIIQFLYEWHVVVRTLMAMGIISFSFFGLVFGGKAVRFFITWTYITVLPFTVASGTLDWLNIRYLYLTSVGFCVILSAGTVGCVKLLQTHRWKRYVPYAAPLLFVLASQIVVLQLTNQNIKRSRSQKIHELRQVLDERLDDPAVSGPASPAEPAK